MSEKCFIGLLLVLSSIWIAIVWGVTYWLS